MTSLLAPQYTPFYCEENIWHLTHSSHLDPRSSSVVFISNPRRACPLWNQRASRQFGEPVVWDYHVVLLAHDGIPTIWDLDSTLGCPLPFATWWHGTFPHMDLLHEEYLPHFRVIDLATFQRTFSSDRSHMLRADGTWQAPPPTWPCIEGEGLDAVSLERFIDVTDKGAPGRVFDAAQFFTWAARDRRLMGAVRALSV